MEVVLYKGVCAVLYSWILRYNRYLPARRWIHRHIVNKLGFRTKKQTLSILPLKKSMDIIKEKICSSIPFMLARYGFTELRNISRVSTQKKREQFFEQLCIQAGFFPHDISLLPRFIELYTRVEKDIDILLPWSFYDDVAHNERTRIAGLTQCSMLSSMEVSGVCLGYPIDADITQDNCYHNYQYFVDNSYMDVLKDKKVLVVHPFKDTILSQYKKLTSRGILKKCKEFHVFKAVQSIGYASGAESRGGGILLCNMV